jgi:probable sporulation protein (polysaccharide deacetylase family)
LKKWRVRLQLLIGICMLVFLWHVFNSQAINLYVSTVKGKPVAATLEREWENNLEKVRQEREQPAINARIDSVWKAIPGYNGVVLNKEESIRNLNKADQWDESQVVFVEVEPKIGLADLKPSPIYRGNQEKPMISFMINVAWGNEYLPEILHTLEKHKVKSTFFLDGSWTNRFPAEAKKILDAGHEIGNHAYSHPDMKKLSMNRIRLELTKTNQVIQKELGVKPALFAPPSGSYDERAVQLAAQEGMFTVLWTLDTVDWKKPTPTQIVNRITPHLSNGSLILMHPTASSSAALPALLKAAKAKGLKAGTVSELISSKRVPSIE